MLTFKWLFSLYGASLFCSKQLIIIMANYCFFAVAHIDFVVKKANSTDLFEFVSHDMICLNLYWNFLQSVLNYWCSNNDLWMQMFECIFFYCWCASLLVENLFFTVFIIFLINIISFLHRLASISIILARKEQDGEIRTGFFRTFSITQTLSKYQTMGI